jgi:PucR family transcriptional regulator, purine catabolism regulatory protein
MTDKNTATLQALLQFALPLGTSLLTGTPETTVNWSLTVRAQPPAFPEIYGGELALVSMDVLRSYGSRIRLADVIRGLTEVGVHAVATKDTISQSAINTASECQVSLLSLPEETSLTTVERAVNTLIVNQKAQMTQRAFEIQRQLTRLAAENRDLNSLLQLISRATAKSVLIHDDAGVLMSQVHPGVNRRGNSGSSLLQSLPHQSFQNWLKRDAPNLEGAIVPSPIGYTTVLKVEKRIAGYLTLVDNSDELDEFDQLVVSYGADVCAIELAKNRAIASAVEQTRGDWIQMWLSGTPVDDDLLSTRAQQAGFDTTSPYIAVVFQPATKTGSPLPLESLITFVRDDMARRQLNGAVGQYVDVIVSLYPLDATHARAVIEEVRTQLTTRTPSGIVSAGISRPTTGLYALREAYREAQDSIRIANELDDQQQTTYYGDLKLYQLLLALKEYNLEHLRRFYQETLGPLVDHDERKQGDLIRTLSGFFEAKGNLAKAAVDLDVHRNTLVYRLDRITELTGFDLDDADNRLILHLALKVKRVLATLPEG